jgi:hypothetical protein
MNSKFAQAFLELPNVTDGAKDFLHELLYEDLLPVSILGKLVQSYVRVIQEAGRRGRPVNVQMGLDIAASLLTFLERVDERMCADDRHVLQASTRYFVIENDGMGHDLASEDGFFDDARVVNAMLRWFGSDSLLIRMPLPANRRPTPTTPRRVGVRHTPQTPAGRG